MSAEQEDRETVAIPPGRRHFVHLTMLAGGRWALELEGPYLAQEPLVATCASPYGQPWCSCGRYALDWPNAVG